MNCQIAQQWMNQRVDGDLSAARCLELDVHLRDCPACRQRAELLGEAWKALESYETPRVSDHFTARVLKRVEKEPATVLAWPGSVQRRAYVAAALVLMVLTPLALVVWRSSGPITAKHVPPDQEVINNLHIYENIELLENLELLSDFDLLEAIDEPLS